MAHALKLGDMLVRRAVGCFGLVVSTMLFAGCLQTTPLDTDAEHTGLIAKNLQALERRGEPRHPFRFVAMGDTHDEYDDTASAVEAINARGDVELVAHAGDITDRGLLQEFEWSYEVLGRFKMPLLIAIGNHDAVSHGAEIWSKMFGPRDYSFYFGGLKFVFFNSNALEFPGQAPRRDWLRAEIANRGAARAVVVVTHHPPQHADDLPGGDTHEFYDGLIQSGDIALWVHGHLAEPRLYRVHSTPVLQCGTFQEDRYYWVVTVDHERLSFERCFYGACSERSAEETSP
jgi:Icc protein